MFKLISLFFIIQTLFISSCTSNEEKALPLKPSPSVSTPLTEKIKSCTCVEMWMPVCGENGKTYSNTCFANCAGVKFTRGACEKMQKE